MLKTSVSYALVAVLSAGTALTTKELLGNRPGVIYRAHHVELDSSPTSPDGGLELKMKSYITASGIQLPDGGAGTLDMSSTGVCPLDSKAYAAAKLLVEYGATPSCR